MPLQCEPGTTPAGHPCLFVQLSGEVTLEETRGLTVQVAEGARYHRQRGLCRAAPGTMPTAETRKLFAGLGGQYLALAIIVTSPVQRAGLNLVLRLIGRSAKIALFSRDDEALAWLDAIDR